MAALCSLEFGDLVQIKKQLITVISLCKERGLVHSVKWASELAFALDPLPKDELPPPPLVTEEDVQDLDAFALAKSYFDLKEYDRAAYFLRGCNSQKAYFLYMYSRYLGPWRRAQVVTRPSVSYGGAEARNTELGELDGFTLYLYGVVLRKLDLLKEAVEVFVEATHTLRSHWGAWLELCNLVTNIEMLKSLSLPDCWIKDFFMAHIYTELQMIKEALQNLIEAGFSKSTYIISQIAVAYHNIRDIDQALALFNELREQDPYRIENMDTFSNLLYVKSMKPELSYLAHNLVEIDKYRVETCCVIGNYYSLRSQHEKAALYFQRALKLNPRCLGAWTLMGHEYMEMKNTSAAIQAYRHAIEVNKRDYRAWYGLGQTYEILKMPFYCLYYYRKAHQLRPNDSRMLVALGESYEKLSQQVEAKKGVLCGGCGEDGTPQARQEQLEHAEVSTALRYLGQYYFKNKLYDEASMCAQRCCDYNDAREEGKALLRQIFQVRDQVETPAAGLFVPFADNNSPIKRVSPLNLSSFTP
ncbi:LOW QUALITY PROTEIN: hypothetical protein CRUP_028667 [Coryphaenoides rupestris]|nr:LOW QUALITY PROTEIN: hypothetical protein CRUP_028667 [Coryphaenoides rupestris]